MKITRLFSIGVSCAVSGACVIVYAILDYQNKVYEYRYLPSPCKPGSSCPFPSVNDMLILIGTAIIVAGILLMLFRKIPFGRDNK